MGLISKNEVPERAFFISLSGVLTKKKNENKKPGKKKNTMFKLNINAKPFVSEETEKLDEDAWMKMNEGLFVESEKERNWREKYDSKEYFRSLKYPKKLMWLLP